MATKEGSGEARGKSLPINKRWPGKYAFRVACYTPKGGCIEFEVSADETEARAVLDKLSALFNAPASATPPAGDPATKPE